MTDPKCADCSIPYSDAGFCDLVIPDDVFNSVMPEGGLLCPSCLCRRAANAGHDNVKATFTSGPFALDSEHPSIRAATMDQADASAGALSEKVTDPIDLAAKLFDAESALSNVQDAIERELIEAGILTEGWDDWWSDYYDTSIEIKGVPQGFVLSDEQLMVLHDMGFSRIWTHGPDGEKYYGTKPRVSGAELNISNDAERDGVSLNQSLE